LGALGGEVGEVDPEQLPGDEAGRVAGEEMDALDDGVGGEDVVAPGGAGDRRRIVEQAERARRGERREEAGDALELVQGAARPVISRDRPDGGRAPGGRAPR